MQSVALITVNYRSEELLLRLVRSVSPSAEEAVQLVVVDCSGMVPTVRSALEAAAHVPLQVLDTGENLGFARAANLGARAAAQVDVLVFVNPDVVLDWPGLARVLEDGAASGAVAWTGRLRNADGSPQHNVAPAPSLRRQALEYLGGRDTRLPWSDEPQTVGVISGALLCVGAGAFSAVGGFDEAYPLYVEDQDLGVRLSRVGALVQLPIEVGVHLGGSSALSAPAATTTLLHASRVRYWQRRSPVAGSLARATVLAGCAIRAAATRGRRREMPLRMILRATAVGADLRGLLPPRAREGAAVAAECTVIILTLDAAASLPALLEAVSGRGMPLLVVDSGSSDGTSALAVAAGAQVVVRPFDDFASQRTWAMAQATTPYVLFVDADEVVTEELLAEVRDAIVAGVDGAWIPTLDWFSGRWMLHGLAYPQPHLRLLRRVAGAFTGTVHERVSFTTPDPVVVHLESPLLHRSHLSLSHYLRKLDRYTEVEAAGLGGRPSSLLARGAAEAAAVVVRALVLRSGWRDGVHGVVLAVAYGFYRFTIHAKAALRVSAGQEASTEAAMDRWRAVHGRGERRASRSLP